MTRLFPRWALAAGLGCLLLAVSVQFWPDSEVAAPQVPPPERFTGPLLEPARPGVTPAPWLRMETVDAEVVTPEVAAPSLVGLALVGGRRVAYLRSTQSGLIERVGIGSELDGWRVVDITETSASLIRGETHIEASMFPS